VYVIACNNVEGCNVDRGDEIYVCSAIFLPDKSLETANGLWCGGTQILESFDGGALHTKRNPATLNIGPIVDF
jgi:hypothetical protein